MPEKVLFKTKSVTAVSNQDLEGIGVLRWVGDKVFRWVRNDDTAVDLTAGKPCCHTLGNGADIFKSVKEPLTANLGMLAGIAMATVTSYVAPTYYYGWIQVLGYNASISVMNQTNATPAAGDYLKGVNSESYLTQDASTQPLYSKNVQLHAALATHTTVAAAAVAGMINCL